MGVDTRPMPVSILRWPRTRDLISQQKGIYMYLWTNPDQTACGCYLLALDATAADLSMTSSSLADALAEFRLRRLVDLDKATGEILLPDWFRWYWPGTPAARGAVDSALSKIQSPVLREKAKNLYESMADGRKEKGKEKGKVSTAAAAVLPPATAAAAVDVPPSLRQAASGKRRRERPSGLVSWTPDDEVEAERMEADMDLPPDGLAAAIAAVRAAGKQPVPGLVARELERLIAARKAEERHALQLSASALQVDAATSPLRAARSRPPAGWAEGVG